MPSKILQKIYKPRKGDLVYRYKILNTYPFVSLSKSSSKTYITLICTIKPEKLHLNTIYYIFIHHTFMYYITNIHFTSTHLYVFLHILQFSLTFINCITLLKHIFILIHLARIFIVYLLTFDVTIWDRGDKWRALSIDKN